MVRALTCAILGCLLVAAASVAEAKPKVVSAGEWSCSGPWTKKTVKNAEDGKNYNCECQACTRDVCVEEAGKIRCGGKETHSCLEPRNCTAALVKNNTDLMTPIQPGVLDPGTTTKPKPKVFQKQPGVLLQQ